MKRLRVILWGIAFVIYLALAFFAVYACYHTVNPLL